MDRRIIKKCVMLIVAAIALVPFGWEPAQSIVYRPRVEDSLYELMETAGASPVELSVQGWTRVNRKFIPLTELEAMARRSASRLGDNRPELISEESSDFRQVRVQSVLGDGSLLNLTAQSLINYGKPGGQGETYITVNLARKLSGKQPEFWSDKVRSALSYTFGTIPQVLTNITAMKPGEMSLEAQEELLAELFSAARAKKIDGISTEQLCSVTGYTSRISDRLEVGENDVNLNIAIRYHNDIGQTYIYIGSPLLSGEY